MYWVNNTSRASSFYSSHYHCKVEWKPRIGSARYLMKSCVTFFLFSLLMILLLQAFFPRGGNHCGSFYPLLILMIKLLSKREVHTPHFSDFLLEPFSRVAWNPSQLHASTLPRAYVFMVTTSLTLSLRNG